MSYVQAAVLGAIQGLTEFLPISSTGHLFIARQLLGWPDQGLLFDAVLHLGTLVAVVSRCGQVAALWPRGCRS
jgi:undecaprenyl-diphosphatase